MNEVKEIEIAKDTPEDISGLVAEIAALQVKVSELESAVAKGDSSFMLDMIWGSVTQLKAQMQDKDSSIDVGNPGTNMYDDEVGAPVLALPPATADYMVLQRLADDTIAFDYLRAH